MKLHRNEKTAGDKVITILVFVCSGLIIILALLQLTGIWEKAINVYEPFMGVLLLLQAIRNWKAQRGLAIFSLCAAVFVFAVAFIVFFIK